MKKQLFTLCLIACLILSGCSTKEKSSSEESSTEATTEATTKTTTETTTPPAETTQKYIVNKLAFELNPGESEKIEFNAVIPKQVTFESSNPDIASVTDDGTINALSSGDTKIKCITNTNTIVCRVTVKEKNSTKKATEPSTSKKRKKSVKKDTTKTNKTTHSETTIEPETTTTSFDDSNFYEVYITNTGSKYHRSTCSYLRRSKIGISEDDAIAQGYTPCSRCNP